MNETYKTAIQYFVDNPTITIKETAHRFGIDRGTFGKHLTKLGLNNSKERVKKYSFNENYFEQITEPEQAYWLGWLHSDGNVMDNYTIRLRLKSDDKEILELFNKALNSNVEIKTEYSSTTESSNLTLCSKKMYTDLSKYGIVPNKTESIKFIEFEDIELTKAYIRGLFDGDGWCYFSENSREIGFCGNESICNGIAKFLIEVLNIPNIKVKPFKSIYRIRICNKTGIKTFYNEVMKGNRELSLKRKFDKIENFAVSERASKNLKVK